MTMLETRSKDGVTLAYDKSGKGPPLLLIHGTTADHNRWDPIRPALGKHFTVYAMDRRGRGGSGDAQAYDERLEYADVVAVIEAIGGKVAVVGHSYGAICALEATLLTDRMSQLVLYGPPIPAADPVDTKPDPDAEAVQALVDQGDPEGALETFYLNVVRSPKEEIALLRTMPDWPDRVASVHTVARETRMVRAYLLQPERFKNIPVETLLIVGGASPPHIQAAIGRVGKALPNTRTVTLEGQQNQAIATAPELFAKTLLDFLKR